MNCPHCGAALDDYVVFCPGCGKLAILPKESDPTPEEVSPTKEAAPKKVVQKLYPPPEEAPETADPVEEPPVEPEEAAPEIPVAPIKKEKKIYPAKKTGKGTKRLKILTAVFGAVAVISFSLFVYIFASTSSMRVELTKAQTERASAEAAVSTLEQQVTDLSASLDTVKGERDDLAGQVTDLSSQLNSMESSVSQSTYDKDTAERELTAAQDEIRALAEDLSTAETELSKTQTALKDAEDARDKLQDDYDALEKEHKSAKDEIGFYDTYVVFVMLSSDTKYYHKYDCEDFTKRNFLAYSTKLAEANGYSACPHCKD